ncbi:MAG: hypothetical protein A2079_04765 [Geobacteraceae bacterium GWC2_48_7]|nr:MAG: hypothetical protein A2079_04765 [Geobacteraceae bacterium GWC2_48_7]
MKHYYCTYFDKTYLIRGIAQITSLTTHESHDCVIFVVCLDEITRVILTRMGLRNVVLIPLHLIEQNDEPLLAAKLNRSLVEFYWTLTPTIILRIMERYPEIDLLTYLDADLFFFSAPDPIFNELADGSVLIHEHRFPPSLEQLAIHGKYNVGLLCFRRDEHALTVLRWWRDRCNEWCYSRVEDGKYGDQLYLNDWTERFEGVRVLKHVGAGLAPWNQIQYHYTYTNDGSLLVEGQQVVFYHFHSFDFFSPDVIVPAKYGYAISRIVIKSCYFPYLLHLLTAVRLTQTILPGFDFGLRTNGILQDGIAFLIRREHLHLVDHLLSGTEIITLDDKWACCCASQIC